MRKVYAIILTSLISFSVSAQVFWTEDFGTGCNTGNSADGFTTGNGVWAVTDLSAPANYPNQWYISAHTRNTGLGNCAADCAGGNNQTLHIGSAPVPLLALAAEAGSYLTGFYCTLLNICSTTHRRVESPTIDCTGKTSIVLSSLYYEGGDVPGGTNGDCSVWYYDGAAWTMIDPLAKTSNAACGGTIYGVWNNYSVSLPASADNNPNVKFGFQWDNDDVSAGTDPSAAFDDIQLSAATTAAPVAAFSADTTSGCDSVCVTFTDDSQGGSSRVWSFPGGTPSTSTSLTQVVCYSTPGSYDVTLVSTNSFGSDTATQSAYVSVTETPVPLFSVSDQNLCAGECVSYTDMSTGAVQVYTWTFAGGFPLNSSQQNPAFICYQTPGDFSVTLTVENGTCTNSTTFVSYINVNQAAEPVVVQAGDTLTSTPALTYQWYNVATGAIPAAIFQYYIVPASGDYYVCIQDAFGCMACSDTMTVQLGIGIDEQESGGVSLYPVPASDKLTVLTSSAGEKSMSVYNVLGELVWTSEEKPAGKKITLDISALKGGVYFLELKQAAEAARVRFLKE
jgi:PKD repeat protein